jgi:hypothetical protein
MKKINRYCIPTNTQVYEIIISLFTKCNLNCDFCFENHTNDIDIEAIKNIPKLLEDNYPEELKNPNIKRISIGFLGGELFSDDIPDSMFNIYRDLYNDIILLIRKYLPNVLIASDWLSNGIFTKYTRVVKLLNDNIFNNVTQLIGLSYDPIGRFRTREQYKTFIDTFNYFYTHTSEISITLTKPNIYDIINNKDDFIYNLSKDISIYLNYYIPSEINSNWELYQPNDDDLFNFYKWAIDNNKYQFDIINKLVGSVYCGIAGDKVCVLNKTLTYYNNKFIRDRLSIRFPRDRYFGNYVSSITTNNITEMRCTIGIQKRGCLYCEYNNICTEPCWNGILVKDYNSSICYAKRIIKYLYDHSEIKERYLTYTTPI